MHRLGTVSKNILLVGLNLFQGASTSPLVQMWTVVKFVQGLLLTVVFLKYFVLIVYTVDTLK